MPKCRYCKEKFEAGNSLDRFCSYQHAIAFLATPEGVEAQKKAALKMQKEKRKEARKKKREFYRNDKSWQREQTQKAFNKMRKLEELLWFKDRNLEPECISCGKQNMDWCCGHFKTVGSSGVLRFNRVNTFLQCNRYCNQGKSGNIAGCKNTRGYKQGLIERFGENIGGAILDYLDREQHKIAAWSCEQLEQMRAEFNQRARELEAKL